MIMIRLLLILSRVVLKLCICNRSVEMKDTEQHFPVVLFILL